MCTTFQYNHRACPPSWSPWNVSASMTDTAWKLLSSQAPIWATTLYTNCTHHQQNAVFLGETMANSRLDIHHSFTPSKLSEHKLHVSTNNSVFTLTLVVLWWACLSVGASVCEYIWANTIPIFNGQLVPLGWHCNMLSTCSFVDDIMFSYNGSITLLQ